MNYTFFKLVHVLAVVIFLGNIIVGAFWMHFAAKTKDLRIISFTMKGIIKADRYFTIPGVVVITAGGILAAIYGHFPLLRTGWILWSIIMFSLSGLVFAFKLAPLQKSIYHLTLIGETENNFDWKAFDKMLLAWNMWGFISILTPMAAFVMMIFKIPG